MFRLNKYLLFSLFPLLLAAQSNGGKSGISLCDSLLSAGTNSQAIDCYAKLYSKNPTGPVFEKYIDALLLSGDSASALRITKKQSKRFGSQRPQYEVDYYYLSTRLGKKGASQESIKERIAENPFSVRGVAMRLERYGELEFAVELYEFAESLKPNLRTAFERAQLYAQLGRYDEQYSAYLLAVQQNRGYQNVIRQRIAQNIDNDPNNPHNKAVKKALLERIQTTGDPLFENLLLFVYRQEGNYTMAFDYLKGKAKRGDFRAPELLVLGREAKNAGELEMADEILTYLIAERRKAPVMGWLDQALGLMLEVKLARGNEAGAMDLARRFNSNSCYPCFRWELRRDQFLFSTHSDTAVDALDILERKLDQIRQRYPSNLEKGMSYMTFADALLTKGYYEDAMLEYARAETLLGDSDEGDQSRLGRAMCAFYSGDLVWAKTQLEVLLQSTSKNIANDAMENALLISANSVEDTLMEGLLLLREPMLLEKQGLWAEALSGYEKLELVLIANELYDDVLYKMGRVQLQLGLHEEAATTFTKLQGAAGEGMWKEEAIYYAAVAKFRAQDADAKKSLENYLISYPAGLYTEQARQFYRTFAP